MSTSKRYVPLNSIRVTSKRSDSVVYLFTTKLGRIDAIGYVGKALKVAFHHSWKTEQQRAAWVQSWFKKMDEVAAAKTARKAEATAQRAAGHKLTVGAVLRSSWGYDQTNIDYYQVVALKGKRQVVIRKIAQETQEVDAYMQGKCVPIVNNFIGEEMVKLVSNQGDSVKITSYAWAHLQEPIKVNGVDVGYAPAHWTSYA